MEVDHALHGVDLGKPGQARLDDYYLGGTTSLQADRHTAATIMKPVSELCGIAWANRGFHQRSARWIAGRGVRQFVDVGAGLPTVGKAHDVVQQVIPDARVAYIDKDPMVTAYTKSLIALTAKTTVITANARHPDGVLYDPELRALIDFAQPVGLLITAFLHLMTDDVDPWRILARYVEGLASGSYLALSHTTGTRTRPGRSRRSLTSVRGPPRAPVSARKSR